VDDRLLLYAARMFEKRRFTGLVSSGMPTTEDKAGPSRDDGEAVVFGVAVKKVLFYGDLQVYNAGTGTGTPTAGWFLFARGLVPGCAGRETVDWVVAIRNTDDHHVTLLHFATIWRG
jgi:hypothetical protein